MLKLAKRVTKKAGHGGCLDDAPPRSEGALNAYALRRVTLGTLDIFGHRKTAENAKASKASPKVSLSTLYKPTILTKVSL